LADPIVAGCRRSRRRASAASRRDACVAGRM